MKKIAVFASGSGSNFEALVDAIDAGTLQADVALLICDRPQAKVVDRAHMRNVPTFVFNPKSYPNKEAFEQEIVDALNERDIDLVVLAGYMRLVGSTLLKAYEGQIVNIHPSLLPSFPGKDAVGQAIEAGVKVSGVTIHYVDEGMDTGPIIAQEAVNISDHDTHDSLQQRIQEVEHRLYPETIQKLLNNE